MLVCTHFPDIFSTKLKKTLNCVISIKNKINFTKKYLLKIKIKSRKKKISLK